MIFITDPMYSDLAALLFAELPDGDSYYNGTVQYDTESFYSTLTCSLIVYHRSGPKEGTAAGPVAKIVPVWWDFSTCAAGSPQPNDFSWSEFVPFFPCHG